MPAAPLLDEDAWSIAAAHLPTALGRGRPRRDDRRCLEGVLLVELTGVGWRQLPTALGLGSGVTCWRRRSEWISAGIWDGLRAELLEYVGEPEARAWALRSLRQGRREAAPSVVVRRYDRAGRRRELLEAAVVLLADAGAQAVTVEAVVGRIGVGRQVFYGHFPSRPALLAAIYDEYADVVLGALAGVAPATSLAGLVRASTTAYFDAVSGFGVVIRALVATAPGHVEVEAARRRLRQRGQELSAAQLRPLPGVTAGDLRLTLRLVQAMAEEAATEWLAGRITRRAAERVHVAAAAAALGQVARLA